MLSSGRSGLSALHQLRGQGVRVLIDDFGTGYFSLGKLRNSPLDGIMIDRSFVEEVGHDHEARAVCRAAIALGLAFGLRIVAEGIETEAQAQFLVAEQCHEGQGHLFCRGDAAGELCWTRSCLPGKPRQLLSHAPPSGESGLT